MKYTINSGAQEVIKIDVSCLNNVNLEKDTESSFKYLNNHFIILFCILIITFGSQLYHGFPEGDSIDMTNFTYKYSNYKLGGNPFGIFTAMFLHGGFDHLISNIIFLYPFTLITASILRFPIYLSVIIITGLLAGGASYILNDIPTLGASGWIFGLFGFLTPYYLYNKSKLSSNVRDIPWVFLFMAVYIVWQGFGDPIIDNIAHIIGFISGIGYGFIYFKYYFQSTK